MYIRFYKVTQNIKVQKHSEELIKYFIKIEFKKILKDIRISITGIQNM